MKKIELPKAKKTTKKQEIKIAAMQSMVNDVTCQMYCGDGTGKRPKEHYPICPYYGLEILEA